MRRVRQQRGRDPFFKTELDRAGALLVNPRFSKGREPRIAWVAMQLLAQMVFVDIT